MNVNSQFSLELRACEVYVSRDREFKHFFSLENITHISGKYYVNFKVYSLGKRDIRLLLASSDIQTDCSYEIVIGYAQNTYVEIKKHKGSTKGLMNLNIPNVLLVDQPNEIQVRIEKGIFNLKFHLSN